MRDDDMNVIWCCATCHKCFTFEIDMLDHKRIAGHTNISKVDLYNDDKIIDSDSENELDWQKQNR
jgi:hypothetical protein